ncbi:MAG TPA: methyltransferase, partial [Pyrinomonadaceae bacterium]
MTYMLIFPFPMTETIEKFIDSLSSSLSRETFVKLTLGNYKGADEHLQKIQIRLITTRKGTRLYFLFRGDTRDTAKNYSFNEAVDVVRQLLTSDFFAAHLFTTENDFQFERGKRGSRLNVAKPSLIKPESLAHDREKHRWVDQDAFYLKLLGITNDEGMVRSRAQDKWRQINKFVEIISKTVDRSPLSSKNKFSIVDMGSGKGYLTFAIYEHLRNGRALDVSVTGV